MSFLFRIRAIFLITIKRLWAQKGLTFVTLIGLTIAVALITTVPLYADAVNFRMLQERLGEQSERRNRPPFAYLYNYIGAWYEPVQWEEMLPVDEYLRGAGLRTIGLPNEEVIRHVETNTYRIFPTDTEEYEEDNALGIVNFGTTTNIENNVEFVNGRFPQETNNDTLEVMVTEEVANIVGLQVGDSLTAYNFRESDSDFREFPIEIVGVWRPVDDDDLFWFFRPSVFNDIFITHEDAFVNFLAPNLEDEVYLATWYVVMDGSRVDTEDVDGLVSNSLRVEREIDKLLPETSNQIAPTKALQNYREAVGQLTLLLTAYNLPIIFLILAFIALIVNLSVDQQRNVIAVMRSRGGTPWQVVGFAILEGLILGLIAWGLGTLLGLGFTQMMGRVRSFMDFTSDTVLRVALNDAALQAGMFAIILALIAQVLPTVSASRDTIITYKQQQARTAVKPWWQRVWLDILLLIPTAYGFYLLQEQGSLISVGEDVSNDPFSNPLFFLLPALTIFAFTLLFLRIVPWIMEAISWVLNKTNSVGFLLGVRQLARTPNAYATPLILLILTVSLSVFTASLALTIDYQLFDQFLYGNGTDLNLTGPGREIGRNSFSVLGGEDSQTSYALYLPLNEYTQVPGVLDATRVGKYNGVAHLGSSTVSGQFMGIDRTNFADVAFWRYDFAPYRLGTLTNLMATAPNAVIVSNSFLDEADLQIGDTFRLDLNLIDIDFEYDAQIVGSFDYFPEWYPSEDGPLIVGNLDYIFGQIGSEFPYNVWMRTAFDFNEEALEDALRARGVSQWSWEEPYFAIAQEQTRPQRQGLFGLLSVGFLAASLLTVIGFFMYALYSFRRRFIQLGILRAVGLSQGQMLVYIACEMGFLILTGLGLGTLLGGFVSQQFVPFLQIGTEAADLIPPYLVELSWSAIYQITILFSILFLIAMTALGLLLRRMKIFEAVKLGETA